MWVDSSAAVVVTSRSGLGQIRLVGVKFLRLQAPVEVGRVTVANVRGLANTAGAFTKPHCVEERSSLLSKVEGVNIRRAKSTRSNIAWAEVVHAWHYPVRGG